jgi:regulatory protein
MKTISSIYNKSSQEIEHESACRAARMDAIAYIGISRKTSGRITGWLYKKGYPDSVIEPVIQELIAEGTVNDKAIADSILRSLRDRRAESSSNAYRRLLRLGIDENAATRSIEEAFQDSHREYSEALALIDLKFARNIDTIDELDSEAILKLKQKIFRFLLNRGYSREKALTAMNMALRGQADDEE